MNLMTHSPMHYAKATIMCWARNKIWYDQLPETVPRKNQQDMSDSELSVADMAVQNCIGDAFRGATWVALHNGGGVGW